MSVPINDMTQKQQAVLGMAYKLADALQMDLQLHDRKDKFSLSGTATYDLPVAGEFTIPLNARVWASSVSKKEAGILVRIKGRLWAYLVYMGDAKELHFCLIDAEKCNLRETTAANYSGLFSASMLKKIGAGVVATYIRQWGEQEWQRADTLDERSGGTPEGHFKPDHAGEDPV